MGLLLNQEVLQRRIALLKEVTLFADLPEEALARLVDDFRLREYTRDEYIFRQGDSSRELYVVMHGKIRVFKISPSGAETTLVLFTNHQIVGEFATLDGQPRSATAQAMEPTALLAMTQEKFLQHMREIPDLAINMTRLLTEKIRWTATYAETIAQYDAAGRLLHMLLLYNEQFGEALESGKRYRIDLALNQTDLASLVGARREWVNRILRLWRKRGLLEYDSGVIIILDLARVEAERDSRIEANMKEW
jgi:CRP-like cAMP-binding protein